MIEYIKRRFQVLKHINRFHRAYDNRGIELYYKNICFMLGFSSYLHTRKYRKNYASMRY
jgi:hypothetical protein